MIKVFNRLVTALLVFVVGCLAFVYLSPDYNIYLVRSESMKPTINIGDMIVTGPIDGPINGEAKPGAIITYEHSHGLVTHRLMSINGESLVTKGDAAEDADPWEVTVSDVRGIFLFKLPYIGYVPYFVRTKLGWFLAIILPAAILVISLVKDIIKEALSTS